MKYTYEYDSEGYRINKLSTTNIEIEKNSDGKVITETETYYNGTYRYKYYYDASGDIVKIIVSDYSGFESIFERESDGVGNIVKQPVKTFGLISSSYYANGFLYKGEIDLVDQDGAVIKKSNGYETFEYDTDTEGNQVIYKYRNGQKRNSDHYDEKGQLVKQVEYYYDYNNGTEMPSYEYIRKYSYDETGLKQKYT